MTVELTTIEYITDMVLSFFSGVCSTIFLWFIYSEMKKEVVRKAKKEARD